MLGLPDGVRACLFDLDGVLTPTAEVHARAWKQMFDGFLKTRAEQSGERFDEFTSAEYGEYVDGKPRLDGVRSFLEHRGIELPQGSDGDPPSATTVNGLGTRKNQLVLKLIDRDGVQPYDGSVRYLEAVQRAGGAIAVVSSSANCESVLRSAGLEHFVQARVDGILAEREHLPGKPAPDTFLAAARMLGVDAAQAAVYEDALAGVEAGRAGGFGAVIGVNRTGQAEALRRHGATRVVDDLAELFDEQ